MGSLVYVELLGNPRYRKFLHRAFPWIGHVGIKHFFMAPSVAAAKDTTVVPDTAQPPLEPGTRMSVLVICLESSSIKT